MWWYAHRGDAHRSSAATGLGGRPIEQPSSLMGPVCSHYSDIIQEASTRINSLANPCYLTIWHLARRTGCHRVTPFLLLTDRFLF